jgi:hypothetical protein
MAVTRPSPGRHGSVRGPRKLTTGPVTPPNSRAPSPGAGPPVRAVEPLHRAQLALIYFCHLVCPFASNLIPISHPSVPYSMHAPTHTLLTLLSLTLTLSLSLSLSLTLSLSLSIYLSIYPSISITLFSSLTVFPFDTRLDSCFPTFVPTSRMAN